MEMDVEEYRNQIQGNNEEVKMDNINNDGEPESLLFEDNESEMYQMNPNQKLRERCETIMEKGGSL